MERKRFSFGMQFGLVLRYTLRNVSLLLLMILLLAGALYPQIPIFRSGMEMEYKILLALIELTVAGFLLYVIWINLVDAFIAYSNFRYHVAKTTRNQNWLHEFAEKETDENVRDAAVARISDPDELFAIALQDASYEIRRTAASHLQNAKDAEELIARSKDDSVRA